MPNFLELLKPIFDIKNTTEINELETICVVFDVFNGWRTKHKCIGLLEKKLKSLKRFKKTCESIEQYCIG